MNYENILFEVSDRIATVTGQPCEWVVGRGTVD